MHFAFIYTLQILFLWLFTLTYGQFWPLIADTNLSRKLITTYGPWIFTTSKEYIYVCVCVCVCVFVCVCVYIYIYILSQFSAPTE
jgi:hypothetical protein